MKTSEERKWENSKEIASYFSLFENGFDATVFKRELQKAIDQVANDKAKALLEEAAEKARLKMLEDQKPTPYEMEDFIKSLIPKEETK